MKIIFYHVVASIVLLALLLLVAWAGLYFKARSNGMERMTEVLIPEFQVKRLITRDNGSTFCLAGVFDVMPNDGMPNDGMPDYAYDETEKRMTAAMLHLAKEKNFKVVETPLKSRQWGDGPLACPLEADGILARTLVSATQRPGSFHLMNSNQNIIVIPYLRLIYYVEWD